MCGVRFNMQGPKLDLQRPPIDFYTMGHTPPIVLNFGHQCFCSLQRPYTLFCTKKIRTYQEKSFDGALVTASVGLEPVNLLPHGDTCAV
jgi:hypothetical protein